MPGHMQEGFGCAIANRFDQLFDDESDPFELLKEAENKKKEAPVPGAAKTAAQAAKLQKKESQKDRKVVPAEKKDEPLTPVTLKKDGPGPRRMGPRREGQAPAGGPPREGEGRPPTDRPPRTDRRPPRRFERPPGGEDKPAEGGEFSVEKPIGDRQMRGRGGGRGGIRGGRGRGMGRSDGFDARGKREFDRHSGSDRSSQKGEEKRGGSGSHNWGTVKDEMGEHDQSNVTEETPEGEEPRPADSENKENEVGEPKEVEPKEMTLDEWKAQQDKEKTKVEFNIRKANEGADSQWKKGYVLHKSKDEKKADALIEAAVEAEAVAPKAEDDHHFRKPANDITAQLEINFGDLGRPSRGRGGPRGGRGSRGRGEGRGEFRGEFREPREPRERDSGAPTRPTRGGRTDKPSGVIVPNVDDPEAFPALA
ncbi:plasminogen activator inhibitor 1 RNA-binding protein isoform X1 [Salmo salar]|uniref:Plasminogen activator inhibitor 1 RNA-binding protein isoform X1 n=1 Tax=Salmo salar TaxID=8030 RepID=A0A1S3KIF4_SALSA|nr:plasminogen activator inhibitor 1 RNA-binding protein isoform X1 [Salmo salar]|eukprot:XP_013978511.1 PREDICTED: plasminogen activator inhibitor 1 RNA-binding protein-like isoform X1 [Salmo salar]